MWDRQRRDGPESRQPPSPGRRPRAGCRPRPAEEPATQGSWQSDYRVGSLVGVPRREGRSARTRDADDGRARRRRVRGEPSHLGHPQVARQQRGSADRPAHRRVRGASISVLAVGEREMQQRSYPGIRGQYGTCGWELIRELDLVGHAARIAEEARAPPDGRSVPVPGCDRPDPRQRADGAPDPRAPVGHAGLFRSSRSRLGGGLLLDKRRLEIAKVKKVIQTPEHLRRHWRITIGGLTLSTCFYTSADSGPTVPYPLN